MPNIESLTSTTFEILIVKKSFCYVGCPAHGGHTTWCPGHHLVSGPKHFNPETLKNTYAEHQISSFNSL